MGYPDRKELTRSPLGFKPLTYEAVLMESGGEMIRSTRHGDSNPHLTLHRHLLKIDRILRLQPREFQEIAVSRYIWGKAPRSTKMQSRIDILHHRIDAIWGLSD